jgi:hypothetical protein
VIHEIDGGSLAGLRVRGGLLGAAVLSSVPSGLLLGDAGVTVAVLAGFPPGYVVTLAGFGPDSLMRGETMGYGRVRCVLSLSGAVGGRAQVGCGAIRFGRMIVGGDPGDRGLRLLEGLLGGAPVGRSAVDSAVTVADELAVGSAWTVVDELPVDGAGRALVEHLAVDGAGLTRVVVARGFRRPGSAAVRGPALVRNFLFRRPGTTLVEGIRGARAAVVRVGPPRVVEAVGSTIVVTGRPAQVARVVGAVAVVSRIPIVGRVPAISRMPVVGRIPIVGRVQVVSGVPVVARILSVRRVPVVGWAPPVSHVAVVRDVPAVGRIALVRRVSAVRRITVFRGEALVDLVTVVEVAAGAA